MKLYITIIFLIFIIISGRVKGSCDQIPQPSFTLQSQSAVCRQIDSLTVYNTSSYISLTVNGSIGSADPTNGNVVFNLLVAGPQYLYYSYFDPADNVTICNRNVSFTAVVYRVYPQYQPKCPWTVVPLVVQGDTSPQFIIGNSGYTNLLFANQPGTTLVIGSQSLCYYYFDLMPKSNTVPTVTIKPTTCRYGIDGTVTVSNYSNYSLLVLFDRDGRQYQHDNGVFSGLIYGDYQLNVTSTECDQQLIPLTVGFSSPTMVIKYSSLPCDGSNHIYATLAVPGLSNVTFFDKNFQPLSGNTMFFRQNTSNYIFWSEYVGSIPTCYSYQEFTTPLATLPITYTITPPISTLYNPSVIQFNYPGGSASDLIVDGKSIFSLAYQTQSGQLFVNVKSKCGNSINIQLQSLKPIYQVIIGNCAEPSTVIISNYQLFSNITLSNQNGILSSSVNGTLKIPYLGNYTVNAEEMTNQQGITPKYYSFDVEVDKWNPINESLVAYEVEYITLPSTPCQRGTVKITPTYNNTVANSQYYPYQPGQGIFVSLNACPAIIWTPPQDSFDMPKYELVNTTLTTGAYLNVTLMNGVQRISVNGQIYPVGGITSGTYNLSLIGIPNQVIFYFFGSCSYTFNAIVFSPPASIQPIINVTPQSSDNCNVVTGSITLVNRESFSSFNLYDINGVSKMVSPGYWTTISGDYNLTYTVGYSFGSLKLTIPTTGNINAFSTVIEPPSCQNTNTTTSTDSKISFTLSNSTKQLQVTGFSQITGPSSQSLYFQSTNQLIGNVPGDYYGYVESWNCKRLVNFTIPNYASVTFPITTMKVNGSFSGFAILNNPNNTLISSIDGATQDTSNYFQFTNLGSRGTIKAITTYNEVCKNYQTMDVDFSSQPYPSYTIVPTNQCGSSIVQFSQYTLDHFQVRLVSDFGSQVIENNMGLLNGDYKVEYISKDTFQVISDTLQVNGVPISNININYTYYEGSCTFDGQLVINNPDSSLMYMLYDKDNGYNLEYNFTSHSFQGVSASANLQLTSIPINGKIICDNSPVIPKLVNSNQYMIPTIQVDNSCSGGVTIGAINSTLQINGVYSINGTKYTNNSINLPSGYYELVVETMSNQYCSIQPNQLFNFNFTIKQCNEINTSSKLFFSSFLFIILYPFFIILSI